VGGLIEAFVSRERMTGLLPRSPLATVCVAAALGLVFPVCECAVVPKVTLDQWVDVEGVFELPTFGNRTVPLVRAERITLTAPPPNPFLY
jgi:uncharacterized membrane protein YcgQ (UPF0703/DUF1980 family)